MALADQLVQAKNKAVGSNLTASLPDTKQQTASMFQNNNQTALASTNYQNLTVPDITSGYKNQIGGALSNASNYDYVKSNNVGMDNTPYANAINGATNNANSQATSYQNAIQNALNTYNGVSNIPTMQEIRNQGIEAFLNGQDTKSYGDALKNYYANDYNNAVSVSNNNSLDQSQKQNQIQNIIKNASTGTSTASQNTDTPQSNADYIKGMTDKINNLYDTQRNNIASYYQTGINQAKQQYQGLRNQASVTDQQNLNKLKESMAQQGLFNSGDNITSQTGINNEYAGNLAGYNQQEQNYYDTVNNQIAQQKAQYDAQQAQVMMDLYNNADTRSFKLANLNNDQKQQAFQNAMTGINAQYGMGQDQFGNTLKGTSTTYGMGRDNVSDQMYNNDSQMKADQINYGRDQDYFNNQLKSIAQQYGMDQDQVNNLLNYAKFNSSEDQRQYENSTGTNNANYNMYNDNTKNNQAQQQINLSDRNAQWGNSQWAQNFIREGQWHDQAFEYQQQQDALKNALAQSRAAAASGGSRSSGSSKSSSSSSNSKYAQYADDAAQLKAMGYDSSFINASMPTWNYEASPYTIYSGGR